jgi:hypothetical protein
MRLRNTQHRKSLVHGLAQCSDCSWCCEDYLTVQRKASQHAHEKGHRVVAELGYYVEYGKEKP